MTVLKGIVDQEIVSKNTELDINKCTNVFFTNLGSSNVNIGLFPLVAGKSHSFKSSNIVLKNQDKLSIKFEGNTAINNRLYIQLEIATESCNCLEAK